MSRALTRPVSTRSPCSMGSRCIVFPLWRRSRRRRACRSSAGSATILSRGAASVPGGLGLAVNVDLVHFERWGEREVFAFALRSQTFCELDRWRILLVDAVDDMVPAESVESPIDGRGGAF